MVLPISLPLPIYQGQSEPSGYQLLLLRAELAHTEPWVETQSFFPGSQRASQRAGSLSLYPRPPPNLPSPSLEQVMPTWGMVIILVLLILILLLAFRFGCVYGYR